MDTMHNHDMTSTRARRSSRAVRRTRQIMLMRSFVSIIGVLVLSSSSSSSWNGCNAFAFTSPPSPASSSSSLSSSSLSSTPTRSAAGSTLQATNSDLVPLRQGSSVAIVTPMIEGTGAVDIAGLRRLLQYHVSEGTDNLCILGTTGEANTLTMEERDLVLKAAVDEVKGQMPIMVGTGTIDPVAVKTMTQHAMDVGCDAALVVTPYYVKPPQRCLVRHFCDAADIGLPVVIYNVPGRTGVDFTDASIVETAQHPNIVAVKDATGDMARVTNLQRLLKEAGHDDILLYSGDDGTTAEFMKLGGDGCISVTANVAANAVHRLVAAGLQGNFDESDKINSQLQLLNQKLFVESNPIPVKWAAAKVGLIDAPYLRPPLDRMDPQYEPEVEEALRSVGLL